MLVPPSTGPLAVGPPDARSLPTVRLPPALAPKASVPKGTSSTVTATTAGPATVSKTVRWVENSFHSIDDRKDGRPDEVDSGRKRRDVGVVALL